MRRAYLTRRSFLRGAAGTAGLLLSARTMAVSTTRKVHVVFKTHLDIGFTNLAAKVVARYRDEFLPAAIRLARETRERQPERRFKWTTGSWLIYTTLEQGSHTLRNDLEQAIVEGDITWHALPFTTHSEVLDASLFDAGMQLSKRLDARFGHQTIAAKMTDVPGHTRGIVPLLQAGGIQLLHIGVNPASMPPDVPPVFLWRTPDGARMAVMHQKDYGGVMEIPGTEEAVAIIFTGDNHGPQNAGQVAAAYDQLQRAYPESELVASDLDQVARLVTTVAETLPAVTGELGDSWIHGVGSDPLKIAQLRALARLRRTWLDRGALTRHSEADLAFSVPLCMIGEHTWGLDVKTHLQAWDVYTPDALAAARHTAPFQHIEASWQEKRAYITEAIAHLPASLRSEAEDAIQQLRPAMPSVDAYTRVPEPGIEVITPHYAVAVDATTGALVKLQNTATGRNWAAPENPLGLFAYQTFCVEDYTRFLRQYLTAQPDWALKDFGKPGIETMPCESRTWLPRLTGLWMKEDTQALRLLVDLALRDEAGHPVLGCPATVQLAYVFPKATARVDVALQWFGKRANRLPEALWLSFVPRTQPDGCWTLDKMGQAVDPADVVRNGGHKLHAVQRGVRYSDGGGALRLTTLDAPLIAPGDRTLLNFDNAIPKAEDGVHVCLYNNVWGTNFVMWFDDDMRFRFTLEG